MIRALLLTALLSLATGDRPALYDWVASYAFARASVASRYEYSPELLCGQATVHGRMVKHPPQRPEHYLSRKHVELHRAHNIPIRQKDEAFVSDKHRFIYIRGHKAASTTSKQLLEQMFCGGRSVGQGGCDDAVLRTAGASQVFEDDEARYMEYFVFTFVRNPFTRVASGYLYMSDLLRDSSRSAGGALQASRHGCAPVPFAAFARDSYAFVKWCKEELCCPGWQHPSAEQLARDKLPPTNLLKNQLVDLHFNDQSHNSFRPDGEPMVDFIGRVESFDADWAELWAILAERNNRSYAVPGGDGRRANPGVSASGATGAHANRCGADAYEDLYDEASAFDIAIQYALDFQRFGFAVGPGGGPTGVQDS